MFGGARDHHEKAGRIAPNSIRPTPSTSQHRVADPTLVLNLLPDPDWGDRSKPVGSAAASLALHILLVVSMATATRAVILDAPIQAEHILKFLIPPNRSAATSIEERANYVTGGSTGAPAVVAGPTAAGGAGGAVKPAAAAEPVRQDSPQQTPAPAAEVPNNAFSIIEVDSAAERDPTSAAPAYPKSLIEKGLAGHADFRFVVDSTGVIDMATVKLIKASHPDFARAVRDAMPHMKFRAARMGETPVRQLAEQSFVFQLQIAGRPAVQGKKPE